MNNSLLLLDGPPFTSGDLHIGHALISFIKNTIARYYGITEKLGNDCHGLPIELLMEKTHNISPFSDKKKFISICKEFIDNLNGNWEDTYKLLFRDYNSQYFTKDTTFMESEWWAFKQLYDKGLVYFGYKIAPYSISCKTAISNFEADYYKEVNCNSLFVKFKLVNNEFTNYENLDTFMIAWTTTTWTLPMNLCLCVNPENEYVLVHDQVKNENYVLLNDKKCLEKLFGKGKYRIIKKFKGIEIKDIKYIPLFDNFSRFDNGNFYKVLCDKYVENSNTGIVHIAPGFGEDDYNVSIKSNVINESNAITFCAVTADGNYNDTIQTYSGRFIFDCENDIYMHLKTNNMIIKKETFKHNYPHCWRTETPLIYKLEQGVFIKVTSIIDKIVANNEKSSWFPEKCGKRFKNWLANPRDWFVSRKRVFGTPIPIWMNDTEIKCIGSIQELVEQANLDYIPTDLHLDTIEDITIPSSNGGEPLRIAPFIFDCWFDSGVVPIAHIHYPFENSDYYDNRDYLTDIICEGSDQTRGWFYTLSVIATAIFDKPAFKDVICTGLVLDKNKEKFSKKNKNCVPVKQVIDKYGSDAFRIYLISSPASNGDSFPFNEGELEIVTRMIHHLKNCFDCFTDHHNKFIVENNGKSLDYSSCNDSDNIFDIWIKSRVVSLKTSVDNIMENRNFSKVQDTIYNFIEDLSNWYINFNRDRLKGIHGFDDTSRVLSTLYNVCHKAMVILEPFMPETFQLLNINKNIDIEFTFDPLVEKSIKNMQNVTDVVRKIRNNIFTHKSTKMPINKIMILHPNENDINALKYVNDILKVNMNCLTIEYPEFSQYVNIKYNPNFKNIATKYKKETNIISNLIKNTYDISQVINQYPNLDETDYDIIYSIKEFDNMNGLLHSNTGYNFIVIVDTSITDDIKEQYNKRLLVSFIQKCRKNSGLKLSNFIKISINNNYINDIINKYKNQFEKQINCEFIEYNSENIHNSSFQSEIDNQTFDMFFYF